MGQSHRPPLELFAVWKKPNFHNKEGEVQVSVNSVTSMCK